MAKRACVPTAPGGAADERCQLAASATKLHLALSVLYRAARAHSSPSPTTDPNDALLLYDYAAVKTARAVVAELFLAPDDVFGAEILRCCVELGGVLTGEHGVGIEKRDLMPHMFSEVDLQQQQRLKCAFDARGLLNPGKVFPTLHRCAELGRVHVHKGKLAFPDLPRF